MRSLALLFMAASALAQSAPSIQISNTTESLRGVSAVSRQIAWASGTHGTYLRTIDGGRTWTPAQAHDAATLDFRAVAAFSADEAFLMSAGPGDQSRIYHTSDAGQHWQLQFTNTNPKGFFDSMTFWNPTHGIVLGDPIPDESGKLKFEVLLTDDGQTWHAVPPSQLPDAIDGEGAFAASNSCIAILSGTNVEDRSFGGAAERRFAAASVVEERRFSTASAAENERTSAPSGPDLDIWFATGGKVARVFHSPNGGQTWEVYDTPIRHGLDSTGIFSIAFFNKLDGVIAGGDYKHPKSDGPNLAFTHDGGKTWDLSTLHPLAYFSVVAYDRQMKAERKGPKTEVTLIPERLFIIAQDFVLDFRPPSNPRRTNGRKKQPLSFNAVSPYPEGGALVVGPKGTIVFVP